MMMFGGFSWINLYNFHIRPHKQFLTIDDDNRADKQKNKKKKLVLSIQQRVFCTIIS